MSEAARDDEELTPEERAQLRVLLRLLRKASRGQVDDASTTAVGRKAPRKVLRDREPPAQAYDDVINMRRRRGGDGA